MRTRRVCGQRVAFADPIALAVAIHASCGAIHHLSGGASASQGERKLFRSWIEPPVIHAVRGRRSQVQYAGSQASKPSQAFGLIQIGQQGL